MNLFVVLGLGGLRMFKGWRRGNGTAAIACMIDRRDDLSLLSYMIRCWRVHTRLAASSEESKYVDTGTEAPETLNPKPLGGNIEIPTITNIRPLGSSS